MKAPGYTRKDVVVGILCAVLIVLTAGGVSESRSNLILRRRCARRLPEPALTLAAWAWKHEM